MIRFQTFFFRLHLFRVFFRWRVPRLISAATTKTTTTITTVATTLTAAATATTTSTRAALEVLNSSISLVCLLFQLAHTIFDSASDWKWFFAAAAVYSRFFSLAASKWFFSLSMCGCLVQHYFAKKNFSVVIFFHKRNEEKEKETFWEKWAKVERGRKKERERVSEKFQNGRM